MRSGGRGAAIVDVRYRRAVRKWWVCGAGETWARRAEGQWAWEGGA
jgi:hypothetical protein